MEDEQEANRSDWPLEPDVNAVDFDKPLTRAEERAEKGVTPKPHVPKIPVLPPLEVSAEDIKSPSQRSIACANMRFAGTPWPTIVKELGYASVADARAAYVAALANAFPPETMEVARQEAVLRAEHALQRSTRMASADYLVIPETGERVPNTEKRLWHDQANKDLALLVAINGAKAPTRVEVNATTQELNQMVEAIIVAQGGNLDTEADVFEITELPPEEDPLGD